MKNSIMWLATIATIIIVACGTIDEKEYSEETPPNYCDLSTNEKRFRFTETWWDHGLEHEVYYEPKTRRVWIAWEYFTSNEDTAREVGLWREYTQRKQ